MPIYEYECPSCSSRFDQKRSFSDEGPVTCPKCRCEARRIYYPVPIIFKGSGFYVTDNKGDHGHSVTTSSSDKATSGDLAKTKAGSAGSAKSDTK